MNFSNGFSSQRNNASKNKLQFRIHYKSNFKTVEQIAQEASNNIHALQNLPKNQTDFGLKEHYYFENFDDDENWEGNEEAVDEYSRNYLREVDYSNLNNIKEDNSLLPPKNSLPPPPQFEKQPTKRLEKLVQDNFQQVIEQTEQAFDDCYMKFENYIDAVMQVQSHNNKNKHDHDKLEKEKQRPNTFHSSRPKKLQDNIQLDQQIKKNTNQNFSFDDEFSYVNGKRPVTAIKYNVKISGKQHGRSLSPKQDLKEDQPINEIQSKWTNFLQDTDKNLEKYTKQYVEKTKLQTPPTFPPTQTATPLASAAVTATGPFYQTHTSFKTIPKSSNLVRSLSSRSSLQTQSKIQGQNNMVELHKLSSLLKKEMESGFNEINLKMPFLSEKLLETLLENKNFKPKDIFQDIYQVNQNYIYLLDQQFTSKIEKLIQINGITKRYLYREICSLLYDKLDIVTTKLYESQNDKETSTLSFLNQLKLQKEKAEAQEEAQNKLLSETQNKFRQEINELNEKYDKLKNENLLLTDNVRQLKRDLIQQQADMKYYQIQSTNEFEKKLRELLEKNDSLEKVSTKNDEHYAHQYECMNDLVSNHQSAIVKLRLSKETIVKQTAQIEQLINEISRLNVRASTQFHDLTPRPSLTELEDICNEINDPNFKTTPDQADKQKNSITQIKFSDADSLTRIKKISQVVKQGFTELKDTIFQLQQRSDSLSQQSKLKNKQQIRQSIKPKVIQEEHKSPGKSKRGSVLQQRRGSTEGKDQNNKKVLKKSKFEKGIVKRESLKTNELNLSDNLSLNSEDKYVIQKQSIDEYEDSFNDF